MINATTNQPYKKGDVIWFDKEGIGSTTPLSYFGWDFADYAIISEIDENLITLEISQDIKIICTFEKFKLMITAP